MLLIVSGAQLLVMGVIGEYLWRNLDETRRRLRDALARADFRGQTGRIRFDEHGDSRRGVVILAVEAPPGGRHAARLFTRLGES